MDISVDNKTTFSLLILLLSSLCFSPQAWALTCDAGDKAALLDFKAGITSDPSDLLKSWTPSTDCCSWEGIGCDASGKVIKVTRTVTSNKHVFVSTLNGTLSPSLGKLTHLEVLDLTSVSYLKGAIPQLIGNLSRIQSILLSGNQLSGEIPTTISSLSTLRNLHLEYNQLYGDISHIFYRLSSLSQLVLAGNRFHGSIPLISSKVLTWLNLRSNDISGHIPEELGNYSLLTNLDLSHNNLTGGIPEALSLPSNLQFLYLQVNQLSGGIPGKLLNMSSIVQLDVSNNTLSGEIPPHTAPLDKYFFINNPDLCGAPLPACKHA